MDRAAYAPDPRAKRVETQYHAAIPAIGSTRQGETLLGIGDGDARHEGASFLRRRSRALVVADNEVALPIPVAYSRAAWLFHHQTRTPGGHACARRTEEIRSSQRLSMSSSGIFSGTRPLQQGDEGASQNHGACMSQNAQGCGCVVRRDGIDGGGNRIHPPRADGGAKGVPLARRRDISIRAEFPASTRHVPLATRRATIERRGDPLPSYIDVSASQRAPKPTRPVCLNLESPADLSPAKFNSAEAPEGVLRDQELLRRKEEQLFGTSRGSKQRK